MKAEEHLWAGVVGGFHAKCTVLGKFVFKCRRVSHVDTDFLAHLVMSLCNHALSVVVIVSIGIVVIISICVQPSQ